jgi:flagellar P-ring protein precursor FlgI
MVRRSVLMRFLLVSFLMSLGLNTAAAVSPCVPCIAIGDLATIEGVRNNPLIGYGMVVGLAGTGDRRQTVFSTQTLGNVLQKMGVQIPVAAVSVKNVAAVFVTATLPPFARPGTQIDVTVSSIGDAISLDGGTLLLAPLYGADGLVYAEAQGTVTLGGFSAGRGANSKQVNHPTAGRISNGGLVERDTSLDLHNLTHFSLLLRDPDSDSRAISPVRSIRNLVEP